MVGADLIGDVAIIDDVITAGTAIRESFEIINASGASAKAVFLALDRQEVGQQDGEPTTMSAIQQVETEFGIPVVSIATLGNLIDYLKEQDDTETLDKMLAYREQYGI